MSFSAKLVLSGHDTVEVCYYLARQAKCQLDFQEIGILKETLRLSKQRESKVIGLGLESFVLKAYGSKNGFPFVMENADYIVEFGEFNHPSFRVKFRSRALWQHGVLSLHQRFMTWAESIGLYPTHKETLSRVDFTFDYVLPEINFDEDSVVSLAKKDNKHRDDGELKGLVYGKGDVVLRIYDKVLEIAEKSNKVWFFQLWGVSENVWRIEWQTRQAPLRRFGIRTVDELLSLQGDLLRYLVTEHDSLRIKSSDSNRSRWPLHPLWQDLMEHIKDMEAQGVYRVINEKEVLGERLMRIAISTYGNLKRIGAIYAVQQERESAGFDAASRELQRLLKVLHDPLTWETDVNSRIKEIRFGQW